MNEDKPEKDKKGAYSVVYSVGEVFGDFQRKDARLAEALQQALENAPPPTTGDVQRFRVVSIELEHGGITFLTKTRVTLEVRNGTLEPLPDNPDGQ